MDTVLALDIGGTNLKSAVISKDGEIEYKKSIKTPQNYEQLLKAIADLYRTFEDCVEGISIAIPGGYDFEKNRVFAPNLAALNNHNIMDDLSRMLATKIAIENDANLAALGEYVYADKKSYKNMIFLTLGTGCGGGMIIDGKIPDTRFSIFEVGHTVAVPNGRPCECGRNGCLDEYTTIGGLLTTYHEVSGKTLSSAKEVYALAMAGDTYATESFEKFGAVLAEALINIANLFCPDKIKIGGGLSNFSSCFMQNTIEQFDKYVFPLYKHEVTLEVATLGNDAGLLGATAHFYKL